AEQIISIASFALLTIDHQIVGQPTCLCTLTTVGAAAAQSFASQALTAVSHAQSAVDENFQRHWRFFSDRFDFVDRKLASDNHSFHPQSADKFNAARLGQRHLRRTVNWQLWRNLPNQPCHTPIL